jgi:hypothetical protein
MTGYAGELHRKKFEDRLVHRMGRTSCGPSIANDGLSASAYISEESLVKLARRYGINLKTVQKWRQQAWPRQPPRT